MCCSFKRVLVDIVYILQFVFAELVEVAALPILYIVQCQKDQSCVSYLFVATSTISGVHID